MNRSIWILGLLTCFVAMLPADRCAELPLSLAAITTLVLIIRDRALPPGSGWIIALYLCYAVPMAIASFDAVAAQKSWSSTLSSLRFGLFAIAFLYLRAADLRLLGAFVLAIVAFWCLDAVVQSAIGINMAGLPASERVNGMFGTSSLKLGPVFAAFAPIALMIAWRFAPASIWLLVYAAFAATVLLTGTRSAWIAFAVSSLLFLVFFVRMRRPWLAIGLPALLTAVFVLAVVSWPGLQERVDRSMLAFEGELDAAISYRMPIWQTAWRASLDNPLTGVGVRGFRYAYEGYADADDRWVQDSRGGAFHPHQLLLEVWSETGVIGLLGLAVATGLGLILWRRNHASAQAMALGSTFALTAVLFPINTHFAFYSTFWASVFWWLTGSYCAALLRAE